MALTSAEKQKRFRAKMKAENRSEVRGIYATPENEQKIKEYARKLLKRNSA